MFDPPDLQYVQRVRQSFDRQSAMRTIGALLSRIDPGAVDVTLPYRADLTQQHGYLHAGIIATIVDTAGGYAGFTLFPAGASVLTVEYKLNLLAPGEGESFVAEGRVVKPGRTLCIVQGEVYALTGDRRVLCALMQQTLMVLQGQPDDNSRKK